MGKNNKNSKDSDRTLTVIEAFRQNFDIANPIIETLRNPSEFINENFSIGNASAFNALENWDAIKSSPFSNPSIDKQLKLEKDIAELRQQLKDATQKLEVEKINKQIIEKLKGLNGELETKMKMQHVLSRINEDARQKLFSSESFARLFENLSKCDAVVVSIDIRRSTELMLKAKTPELFSKFITKLSFALSQIIINNYGIFDKFTGDGILAFFPKFYSGEEAIVRALKASQECHTKFFELYNNSRDCFSVFIKDIGLGIGIDYGDVTLVNTPNELTVVGVPVVYACRFSGAKAGETLLNQSAKEEVLRQWRPFSTISETEILIKNEGIAIAYKISIHESAFVGLADPNWDSPTQEENQTADNNSEE